MRDLNDLAGIDFLDYGDRLQFILLNSDINNNGALTSDEDISEWNRLVEILLQAGVTEYEKIEVKGGVSNE